MILVLPFCIKDCKAALANIEWSRELDGKQPFRILLAYDSDVPPQYVERIAAACDTAFSGVLHLKYNEWMGNPCWPNPQNYSFQTVVWEIINNIKEPFLFWEPDAIPIRKNWAKDLWDHYQQCGKPFMGHIVHGAVSPTSMHLNGVAIYPKNPHEYSTGLMIPPEGVAWDVAGADGCVQNARHSSLIMNIWESDSGFKPVSHGGVVPTFPTQEAVDGLVDFEASLFHRCKDLTLIPMLRERLSGRVKTQERPRNQSKKSKRRR